MNFLVLQILRNKADIEDEIEEINFENKENNNSALSLKELFSSKELRLPLLTSLLLQLIQQLCGINAVSSLEINILIFYKCYK